MWSIFSFLTLLVFGAAGQVVGGSGDGSDENWQWPEPIVEISQGTVIGSVADDGDYFQFYGIPYADSSAGGNRFKAPNPPPLFKENFIANRKGVKCIRASGTGFEGTQDCLVVDVFTSSLDSDDKLPVMVWVKGREFDRGHQQELSFVHFIEKEVVIVSLNYRESILGFLCLGTETAPGNAGLKDIIAGLRWVQENIAQFGGDPENVSIFGHGSGAAAVDLITMSPMSKGLVHKAISQSGTAIAPWAVTRDNLEYAVQVAEALGHTVTNIEDLSDLFSRISIGALMATINELELTDNSLAFSPCLENEELTTVEPFLIKSPYQTIIDGEVLPIPFMTGFVDSEGTIRAEEALEDDWLERMNTSFSEFLQTDLQFEDDTERTEVAQKIRSTYFGDGSIKNIDNYISYHGDTMILVSAVREVRMRTNNSMEPVYLYQFSYKGDLGKPFVGPLEVENVAHSEDLAYLFNDYSDSEPQATDLIVSDILIERWTNFAKHAIPTSETSSVRWRSFSVDTPFYLRIVNQKEIEATLELEEEDPHPDTLLFWDEIYDKHFLDAKGRWTLSDDNNEDSSEEEGNSSEEDEVTTQAPLPPTVTISQGTVTGLLADDGEYFKFYGMPYADSTSGRNRFKAPNPPPTFTDTFIAERKGVKCVRALGVGFEGTEDCLVVDVFTPSLDSDDKLPVMVWIKGREFDREHQEELSFKHFIEKEVVVVSLNFRESILGFLCLGTETAPGNAGLKDIIAGLRWVQENIAQFGGDPENVSIFGHGSGAAAVDLITMSPMAHGLVHKAIAQSGSAIAPWAVTRDNLEYAVQVAEALGHTITNIEDLSALFTRTSVAALMAAINELELTDNSLAFSPCIENRNLYTVEPFLIKSPYETIFDRELLQIPFMTGFVDSEGTIRAEEALEDDWLERMDSSFSDFLQTDLTFHNKSERLQVAQQIRSFYFDDESITSSNIGDYISYHGDTLILVSAIREARMRAQVSIESIYLYQFSYKGVLGAPFEGPLEVDNAAHSEELAYLFHDSSDTDISDIDLTVSDILIERWTNFAKTGIPSSETSTVQWQPFTLDNSAYLRILDDDEANEGSLEIELRDPHPKVLSFWEDIYESYFLDAEGKFDLSDRNEEGEEEISGEEDESPEDSDEDDGASTIVGCTFLIITLFSILNQFHMTQILS